MIVRRLIPILLLFFPIYSQVYYLEIYNPNSYDLVDYQLKINVSQYNIPIPIAKIETINGTNVPFCYEQPNGECNSTYTNTTEIIWIKLPYVKARWYTHIKIIVNGTNGAVHGDKVFDFYDDFNDNDISDWGNTCDYLIENGWVTIWKDNAGCFMYKQYSFPEKFIIETHQSANINDNVGSADYDVITGVFNRNPTVSTANRIEFHGADENIRLKIIVNDGTNSYTYVTEDFGDYDAIDIYYRAIWDGVTAIVDVYKGTYIKSFSKDLSSLNLGPFNYIVFSLFDGKYSIDWVRVRKYADGNPIVRRIHLYDKLLLQHSSNLYRYQFTYLYVIPIRITSNSPIGITNLVIPIRLDTKSLISQGILKSDCSDISVTIYDPSTDTEINAKQYIDTATCNTDNTIIYVNIPEYFVGRDIFINIYLGSPGAVPIQDPETFYWFVDLSNPSDYNKIQIFTNGTVSYNITTEGLGISIGSDGKLVIYNR